MMLTAAAVVVVVVTRIHTKTNAGLHTRGKNVGSFFHSGCLQRDKRAAAPPILAESRA